MLALSFSLLKNEIDEKYYFDFKSELHGQVPESSNIFMDIEQAIDIDKAKSYLKEKVKEIEQHDRSQTDLRACLITPILEEYIYKRKTLPKGKELDRLIKIVLKEYSNSSLSVEALRHNVGQQLNYQRNYQKDFETRLYQRWNESIDRLEILILVAREAGENKRKNISVTLMNKPSNYKSRLCRWCNGQKLPYTKSILTYLSF